MVTRSVVTRRYDKELSEVFGTDEQTNSIYRTYQIENSKAERDFCGKLAEVMIRAMLSSHSVLKNSERLTEVIGRVVFRDAEEKIASGIYEYYAGAEVLDIDGYICFVLRGYAERIDEMLYRAVKSGLKKG